MVRKLAELLDSEDSDLYVTELPIQEGKSLFRCHVCHITVEYFVAVLQLLWVSEVDKSNVDRKLVDVVPVLKDHLHVLVDLIYHGCESGRYRITSWHNYVSFAN